MGVPKGASFMVRISEIKRVRSLVCILLDSGESFWLYPEDLEGTEFTENREYDSGSFLQWIRIRQYPRALNLAVSMLARRPCSKGEIIRKLLSRKFTGEVAELVVYKLEKDKLVNDSEFCDQWIRYRLDRGYGLSVIHQELRMKGISEGMISSAFERLDPDEGQENALQQARKYWKRIRDGEDLRKGRQKVITSLVRKGYDWDTAREACRKAEDELNQNSRAD